ncbi:C-X-C motif chemokine 17 [Urocitellus parryii]|uniref:C-X-C motif chemokine ligand 17 n=1 Tax=Urocitellus parryii TaxID=9999 RepID=A0A8D2GT61_UROPR
MKVLILTLLFLPLLLMSMVSSNPNSGVARGHRDQRQASGRRLLKSSQECECKDWFLRASKKKPMTAAGLPKKRCPCDHFTVSVKKTRHRRHHKKSNKHFKACRQFLQRCQLESFALPL